MKRLKNETVKPHSIQSNKVHGYHKFTRKKGQAKTWKKSDFLIQPAGTMFLSQTTVANEGIMHTTHIIIGSEEIVYSAKDSKVPRRGHRIGQVGHHKSHHFYISRSQIRKIDAEMNGALSKLLGRSQVGRLRGGFRERRIPNTNELDNLTLASHRLSDPQYQEWFKQFVHMLQRASRSFLYVN